MDKPKSLSTDEILLTIKNTDFNFKANANKFSVTPSISGLKINKQKLLNSIVNHISTKYNLNYSKTKRTNNDVRVFLNKNIGLISLRLTVNPLYKRSYGHKSDLGSLKSTVAAAMIFNVGVTPKNNIVDNFCGSGTILCEAKMENCNVFGGDINSTKVTLTRQNLKKISTNVKSKILKINATKTPWSNNYFDHAVSNLPWDKQISVESITSLYKNSLTEYKRILKPNGNLCLLVHKPQILIKYAKKIYPTHKIETTKIGFLGQNPTIVLIKKEA